MENFSNIFDIIIIATFLMYGYNFRFKTPPFNDQKGLRLKRACKNEETWAYAHKVGGTCSLIMGILIAVIFILSTNFYSDIYYMQWISWATGVVSLILLIPIVNWSLIAKFGKDYFNK